MKWRKWNNILHRDIGYICVGLTIIYAISGVAVNHTHDWNPNLQVKHYIKTIDPPDSSLLKSDEYAISVLQQLEITDQVNSTFRPDPETLQIFMLNGNISMDINTGEARVETMRSRHGLHEMNYLHLNRPRGLWTWFADLYAVALLLVAVTGIFVRKGKNGLKGRGKWFIGVGVIIPVIFLYFYFW